MILVDGYRVRKTIDSEERIPIRGRFIPYMIKVGLDNSISQMGTIRIYYNCLSEDGELCPSVNGFKELKLADINDNEMIDDEISWKKLKDTVSLCSEQIVNGRFDYVNENPINIAHL